MLLMRKKCELILLVQAIIVAGLITLGTGNSPQLEVRTKAKATNFPPVVIFWSIQLAVGLCQRHLRRLLGLRWMAGNPLWH